MRSIVGETSLERALVISMYSANGLTWAVGDLCDLDTGANFTVKKPVNDTVIFGKVVSIEGPATATSATSTILGVQIIGFQSVLKVNSDAAVVLGVSAQHNGTGNNIETAGNATGRNLVIGDVTLTDATHDIYLLC